jgi:hypothetical protein
MTLVKMASILTAFASTFEAAGNEAASRQVAALAAALRKNGKMDVAMLSKILNARR